MKVFLLQHGDALPAEEDSERPLSERGVAQAKRAAEFLKKMPFYPDVIFHSDRKRSSETAEIICFVLGGVRMELRGGLNPNDDVAGIMHEIVAADRSIMLVGHQPFLGRLASALLGASGKKGSLIDITNASPLVLSRADGGYIVDSYFKNEYMK